MFPMGHWPEILVLMMLEPFLELSLQVFLTEALLTCRHVTHHIIAVSYCVLNVLGQFRHRI